MGKSKKGSTKKKTWDDDFGDEETFSGGTNGLSWLEFDNLMNDWLLERYGARFGEQMWHHKLIDLLKLNLNIPADECE